MAMTLFSSREKAIEPSAKGREPWRKKKNDPHYSSTQKRTDMHVVERKKSQRIVNNCASD